MVLVNQKLDDVDNDYYKFTEAKFKEAMDKIEAINQEWSENKMGIELQGEIVRQISELKHRINLAISTLEKM